MMGFYVETVAMLPQLYLLQKNGGEVDSLHGHYIASTVASRLVAIWFWMEVYVEFMPQNAEYNVPGSMVIAAAHCIRRFHVFIPEECAAEPKAHCRVVA